MNIPLSPLPPLAYYNEIDPLAAEGLRELIAAGLIPNGHVDTRSIEDVHPTDLVGYRQCHFFAGIGGWPLALRAAGWPDDSPVWTGSCPCQPFSAAGKKAGTADKRHLWPSFGRLIAELRPRVVFGEQVASKDALAWLDAVQGDLEGEGYAVGAVDTCAAGFGAPHIRQRLYWVADTAGSRRDGPITQSEGEAWDQARLCLLGEIGGFSGLADAELQSRRSEYERQPWQRSVASPDHSPEFGRGCESLGVVDALHAGRPEGRTIAGGGPTAGLGGACGLAVSNNAEWWADVAGRHELNWSEAGRDKGDSELGEHREVSGTSPTNGFWRDSDWLFCRDDKWRPVKPSTFPLVARLSGRGDRGLRAGLLKGAGNALCLPQAIEIVKAYMAVS